MKFKNPLGFCLLIIFLANNFNSYAAQKLTLKLINADTTFLSINWDDDSGDDKIFTLREKSVRSVPPQENKKYKTKTNIAEQISDATTGEGNTIVYNGDSKKGVLNISGLKIASDYIVELYRLNDKSKKYNKDGEFLFETLVHKPQKQSNLITFSDIMLDKFTVKFRKGDGTKRLVLIREGEKPTLPKNGTFYSNANTQYGKGENIDGKGTFVISSGKERDFKITGLNPCTQYFIMVCEFNGEKNKINYLTESIKSNPKSGWTALPPPQVLPAEDITNNSFKARWSKVKGAEIYEIMIAKDKDFSQPVDNYNLVDVGDIDYFILEEIIPGNYYYKVRANGKRNISDYSKVMEVFVK